MKLKIDEIRRKLMIMKRKLRDIEHDRNQIVEAEILICNIEELEKKLKELASEDSH